MSRYRPTEQSEYNWQSCRKSDRKMIEVVCVNVEDITGSVYRQIIYMVPSGRRRGRTFTKARLMY